MSSVKADAPAAAFSYAQAAKGHVAPAASTKSNSAVTSGESTPASHPTDLAPNSNRSEEADWTQSSTSQSTETVDKSQDRSRSGGKAVDEISHPRVIDTESLDSSSNGDKTTKTDSSVQSTQATDGPDGESATEQAAPKPVFTEAKPPTVNIWAQRAAVQKSKVPSQPSTAKDSDATKADTRRKSEPSLGQQSRKSEGPVRSSNDASRNKGRRVEDTDAQRTQVKPRDAEVPPVASETAWPKPTDVHTEERKAAQDKEDKATSKIHGKTEWTKLPYTPTAVFETRIEGRGAGRMGKGVGKNGQTASARGPPPSSFATEGQRKEPATGGRRTGRSPGEKPDPASPQSKPDAESNAHSRDAPIDVQANGVQSADVNSPITNGTSPSTQDRRRSVVSVKQADTKAPGDAAVVTNGAPEEATSRAVSSEKRPDAQVDTGREGQSAFREGKRGGRKGGNRGGFNNGAFSSQPPFANGFPDFQGPPFPGQNQPNFYPGRGNGGNRGFRNQSSRSQSIPMDAFGRMNTYGYPMMPPMQTFVPEYYAGPYSAGPYLGPQDPVANVLNQIEYYFSVDNLLKDTFLRKQMDSQGWIFLEVIAGFNRMKFLTPDYEVLKSACLMSGNVEIRVGEDGKDRLRKAHGWEQWVLPVEDRIPAAQTDGPTNLRRPSPIRTQGFESHPMSPQSADAANGRRGEHSFHIQDAAASAPFYPGMVDPVGDFMPQRYEEVRGRQARPAQQGEDTLVNGASAPHDGQGLSNGSIDAKSAEDVKTVNGTGESLDR